MRRRWQQVFAAVWVAFLWCGALDLNAQLSGVRAGRFAHPGSIEGTLYAPAGSGRSLEGVVVTASPTGTAVAVASDGRYKITGLRPGNYTLEVSGEGFSRLRITDLVVRPNRRITLSAEELPILLRDGEVQRLETFVVSASKQVETLERFEVRGERQRPFSTGNVDMPRTENDAQPYTLFDRVMIEQSSAMTAEEFVRSRMPMSATKFVLAQFPSDTADNKSMINLSGLGMEETLLLVNGRRVPNVPSSGAQNTPWPPDFNGLPLAAIERIEVLPTSASAIHGGRATGGVMNIVLRQDYEGAELSLTYENVYHGQAPTRQASLVTGLSFEQGRTHGLLTLSRTDSDPLVYADRRSVIERFRHRAWQNDPALNPAQSTSFAEWGSTPNITALPRTVLVEGKPLTVPGILFGPGSSDRTHVPKGHAPGGDLASLRINEGTYNTGVLDAALGRGAFLGLQYPLTKDVRIDAAHLNLRREFSNVLEVFAELSHSENHSVTSLDGSVFDATLPASAPTNIFGAAVRIVTPLLLENSNDRHRLTNDGAVLGFKLASGHDWVSEADVSYFQTAQARHYSVFEAGSLAGAVQRGEVDMIRDPLAYPMDLDRYRGSSLQREKGTIGSANLRTAGPAWRLAAGEIMAGFGLGYQEEAVRDGETVQEWLVPRSNTVLRRSVAGLSQQSASANGEVFVPLVSRINAIQGINELDVQFAARTDHYEIKNVDTTGTDVRYEAFNATGGVRYRPVQDLLIRASVGSAFQPPDFAEIKPIPPPLQGLPQFPNGWFPVTVIDRKRANQLSTGATNSVGGNPHVRPDRTRSTNVGIVLEPRGAPGLRVSLDLIAIRRRDGIGNLSAQAVVDHEDFLPGRVHRGPIPSGDPFGVGPIRHVDSTALNFAREESVNYNLSVDYRRDAGPAGGWQTFLMATSWQHYRRQFAPGQPLRELMNGEELVSAQQSKFTGAAGVNWAGGSWAAGWSSRFFGAYRIAQLHRSAQGGVAVKEQLFHDVYLAYTFGMDSAKRRPVGPLTGITLQIGAKNVFNTEPAFDASNQTTFHSYYGDLRMGRYYLTLRKKF